MKKRNKIIISNEDGSLIVITSLILTLLTLIGTGSLRVSRTESMTAANDVVYKQNLYQATLFVQKLYTHHQWSVEHNNQHSPTQTVRKNYPTLYYHHYQF